MSRFMPKLAAVCVMSGVLMSVASAFPPPVGLPVVKDDKETDPPKTTDPDCKTPHNTPEPATLLMSALGAGIAAGYSRWKKGKKVD